MKFPSSSFLSSFMYCYYVWYSLYLLVSKHNYYLLSIAFLLLYYFFLSEVIVTNLVDFIILFYGSINIFYKWPGNIYSGLYGPHKLFVTKTGHKNMARGQSFPNFLSMLHAVSHSPLLISILFSLHVSLYIYLYLFKH